jgi:endoglucanase
LKDKSGNILWEGKSTPKSGVDKASRENVHIIDFSNCKTKGKELVLVSGKDNSLPFDIGGDMYSKLKYDSLRYFYHARSGNKIEMPYCQDQKWARDVGHPSDKPKSFPGKKYKWDGVEKEYTGGPYEIDATGGWYDAGDHGKYVVNGGISTWTVQNQYEWAKSKNITAYDDNTMTIPESGDGIPDLLNEARWNVECLLKLQIPDGKNCAGMAVHKVADEFWTALGLPPAEDEQTRYYYPPSTCATLNFAAVCAQASRLWEDYDPAFAATCLDKAEVAWNAALNNPEIIAPYGQEAGSGTYGDDNPDDEYYWAACELFITSGKTEYLDYLKDSRYALSIPTKLEGESLGTNGSMDWGNVSACGTIDLVLNSDRSKDNGMSQDDLDACIESLAAASDNYIAIQAKEGYGVPLEVADYISEFSGLREEIKDGYPWGSNSFIMNQSIIIAYAYEFTKDIKYFNGVSESMDYLMGRNPNLKCYVTGYGENPVKYPHHRFFCPQIDPSFPSAPPGFMCGGPNSGCQDPWMSGSGIMGSAAQKCYLDHVESWASNEVTINWNAPCAWLTAFLDYTGNNLNAATPTPSNTPTKSPTPTSSDPRKKYDVDNNGAINMADVMKVAGSFNSVRGSDKYNEKYDFDGNGAINMADIMKLAAYFNQRVG